MKFVIVFSVLLVSALARPADDSKDATILKYENDNIGLDSYNFGFETSDGIKRDESAVVNNFGSETEELVVRGSVSWITPEGETITLNYVADKDGYRPEGAHIPSK